MQGISESKINEIRNSADIVNIIGEYIPLKMQGKNYFGICPFHDDHTPSMSVSRDRQLFKCFVCNKGGNVFTFVKDYENISYLEAVKKVADKVGIPLDYNPEASYDNRYKLEYEIMDYTTKILQNNLSSAEGAKAREYLNSRSITDDIIKEFKIGLALDNSNYLASVLEKKKYDVNKLDELGLINKSGINVYDKFINRIMIPLTNLEGKVVGFTGRIFNGEKDVAKYINTKETSIYKKGNLIFNYYNAKNYIREEKKAIIVEGNMDAIRMYSSGVKNVLALMGTVLTKEQIDILKKLRVPIVLMLDNDDAGSLATNNIGEELVKNNIPCEVVRLSGAKDPDEYIVKYGVDSFKDTIKHSLNYFDYKLEYLKNNKNLNNTEELINYVKSVIKMLNDADNLTKEITLKKLSEEYHIDYEVLKSEVSFTEEKKEPIINVNPVKTKNKYEICVNNILYYLMSDSKYLKIFNKRLGFLKNPEERALISEIEYYIEEKGKINLADFLSYAENCDKIKELVARVVDNTEFAELDEETFLEYIRALDNILKKENIYKIKEKINSSMDINEQMDSIEKQIAITKKIMEGKKDV